MAESSETIFFEKREMAGWIHLSRPGRMNALSPQAVRDIWKQLAKVEADAGIRVLVFTGRGEAFCAGMDMAGLENASPMAARRRSREIQMLTSRMTELSIPTVAAVNGVAMGAGLEICLACDLVVASRAARFAFPESRLGMIPCGGGTQRLARLIGLRRARDMIFTGRVLDAEQAVQWGLANEAVEDEELIGAVDSLVEKMAMGGRTALYQAKRCLSHALDVDLVRGLEYEAECFTTCFASGEPSAALRSFTTQEAEPPRSAPEPGSEIAAGTGVPGTSGPAGDEALQAEDAREPSGEEPEPEPPDDDEDIFE